MNVKYIALETHKCLFHNFTSNWGLVEYTSEPTALKITTTVFKRQ